MARQATLAYNKLQTENQTQKELIEKQDAALKRSEADNAALTSWLRESEADRLARWEIIQQLEQHDIPALHQEKDVLRQNNDTLCERLERLNSHLFVRIGRKLGIIEKNI